MRLRFNTVVIEWQECTRVNIWIVTVEMRVSLRVPGRLWTLPFFTSKSMSSVTRTCFQKNTKPKTLWGRKRWMEKAWVKRCEVVKSTWEFHWAESRKNYFLRKLSQVHVSKRKHANHNFWLVEEKEHVKIKYFLWVFYILAGIGKAWKFSHFLSLNFSHGKYPLKGFSDFLYFPYLQTTNFCLIQSFCDIQTC